MSIRASTNAQRLNDRVDIDRPVRDANGDIVDWQMVARSVHAAVDGARASGAERVVADGIRSVAGYTVWLRSEVVQRFGVAVEDRVTWKGRLMDIKDMPDQGLQGRLIALICEVGVNRG